MSHAMQQVLQHPDFQRGNAWWEEQFGPGQAIIEEGGESRDVFLILQGTVRVNKQVEIDDDQHIQSGLVDLHPGDTFGELNLFDASQRSASIVAESAVRVARVDGRALSLFLDRNPDLGYPLLKEFFLRHATQLRAANRRVSSLFSWGLKQYGIDRHLRKEN